MTTTIRNGSDAPTTEYVETTLLELVTAISEVAENDAEIVTTLHHMMESGRLRFIGDLADIGLAA